MYGQFKDVHGKVMAADEVVGIHVINKTASRFTITDEHGEFKIPVHLNDTLVFSGIKYEPKEVVVTKFIISSQQVTVYLDELITELDEVVVGEILTGDLQYDLKHLNLKPKLNFYGVGIPGYTGKQMTQTERRLYAASSGGGLIPIIPIINAISGRTKQLKLQVKLERADACLHKIKDRFQADLFSYYDLPEDKIAAFFYFCQDEPGFQNLCKNPEDIKTLQFLESKLLVFKEMMASTSE